MDDITLQQELEALAGNAFSPDSADGINATPEPMGTTIQRWHKLFSLSADDAVDRIMEFRNNLTRTRVSGAHWEIIRSDKEAHGYDREAFEYELNLQQKQANLPNMLPAEEGGQESTLTYLVELTGPLTSPEIVRQKAGMETLPPVVEGWSVEGRRNVELCSVDSKGKANILRWASSEGGGFEPTILVNPKSLQ